MVLLKGLVLSLSISAQATDKQLYVVSFAEPPAITAEAKLAPKSSVSMKSVSLKSQVSKLQVRQDGYVETMQRLLKREVEVRFRYQLTSNGVALELSAGEAQALRSMPGVADVQVDFVRYLHTDSGPNFIGASQLWSGQATGVPTLGAGVLVGIIDSGISGLHPSFADLAADGHNHVNPRGRRYGLCNGSAANRCTDKLIGIYDYTSEGAVDGSDLDGHGTHVASTAVGNPLTFSLSGPTVTLPVAISGVAPRANVISYKACNKAADGGRTTCSGAALLSAIEQATADQVAVINYSIGGDARDPWAALNEARSSDLKALFNARSAGVVVVVSAGNEGPGPGTVSSPANAPWVLAVANASHDRQFLNTLGNLTGSTAPPQIAFDGTGITGALGDRPIVLGERFGNALCGTGEDSALPPTGTSNPFPPGTFSGQIVVCERGVQARLAKGFNLKLAGAAGMVLVNTALEGESTLADTHFLPAVHLGFADGERLKAWLRATPDARGRISGLSVVRNATVGDLLAGSSSRGPVESGVLKPDLTAPGSSIIAADTSNGVRPLSGTSMASPHVAGAVALLRASHTDWNVAQVESALRGSALSTVKLGGALGLATPFDAGSGRVQVQNAVNAALHLPLSSGDFLANANTDHSALNLPSLYSARCFERCTFVRTVTANGATGASSWSARITGVEGLQSTITPAQFSLGAGASQVLTIELVVSDSALLGTNVFATLELSAAGKSSLLMPVAVFADPGNVPELLEVNAASDRGKQQLNFGGLVSLPRAQLSLKHLAPLTRVTGTLGTDSTRTNPFDDGGTLVRIVDVAADSPALVVFAQGPSTGDVDLFVGLDRNGDGRGSEEEQLCSSGSPGGTESCRLDAPAAGRYWIVLQNFRGANPISDAVELTFGALSDRGEQNARVAGPGSVPRLGAFTADLSWELGGSRVGEEFAGLLDIRADRASSKPIGRVLVRVKRTDGAEQPVLLAPGRTERFALAPNQTLQRIGLEVPSNAREFVITANGDGPFDLALIPAPANEAALTQAPGLANAAARTAGGPGAATIKRSGTAVQPGRYYLQFTSNAGVVGQYSLTYALAENALTSTLAPELYYNPARPGHGLIITRARNDAQIIWYTYDDAGAPTWYWLLPDGYYATNPGSFSGPLLRFTWDGSTATMQDVGRATVTRALGTNLLTWSWTLLGQSGSEPMALLDRSRCVNGSDQTGAWYNPAQPGWGASVHRTPSLEFISFFIYDALGQPRWLLAPDGGPSNGAKVPLSQLSGFCPSCAARATTRATTGSYELPFDATSRLAGAEATGRIKLDAPLLPPLSGRFTGSGDFALLTGKKPCSP